MKKIILLLLISLLVSSTIYAQSKKEKKAEKALQEYEDMKALIEGMEFDFQADWATTLQGRRISLTSNANFLKFRNDSVDIYLPYFGTSTSGGAAMTNDGGIVYSGPVKKFKMSVNDKKKKILLDFEANDKNDTFIFNMVIFKGGNTLINVISDYRSSIKYDGQTRAPKPDKK